MRVFDRADPTLLLTCPNCGARGNVTWKEAGAQRRRWSDRDAVTISDGFHLASDRTSSGDTVIVCNVCDQILPA